MTLYVEPFFAYTLIFRWSSFLNVTSLIYFLLLMPGLLLLYFFFWARCHQRDEKEWERESLWLRRRKINLVVILWLVCVCVFVWMFFTSCSLAHIFFSPCYLPGYEIYIFYALCIKLSYFTLWMRKHTFLWIYLTTPFTFCIMPQTSLDESKPWSLMMMMTKH